MKPVEALVMLAMVAGLAGCGEDPGLLDCRGGLGRCVEAEAKGPLANVHYITDPANLVDVPFTRESFDAELLNQRLVRPWDLEFLPDGSMLVTERIGRILHIRDGNALPAYELKPVFFSLTGLLGLAVDPDFESNRYVYIYYSYWKGEPQSVEGGTEEGDYLTPVLNKIARLSMGEHSLFRETSLLDGIPGSGAHSGGRLEFGPDGYLYASTGDGYVAERAQDPTYLGGKILRIARDGSVPEDNPLPGSPVYSLGHRNPQGLAWHPLTGELYASEHGERRFDEINRIQAGGNYGWGTFECRRRTNGSPPRSRVRFPVICFNRYTMAPSGIEFVGEPESPWYGSLFVSGLRGAHLARLVFEGARVVRHEIFFVSEGRDYLPADATTRGSRGMDSRIRDVEYHGGSLYVIGDRSGLVRLTPR